MTVPEVDAIEGLPPAVALRPPRITDDEILGRERDDVIAIACCRELPNPSVIRRA
jgi:hypothetical protein